MATAANTTTRIRALGRPGLYRADATLYIRVAPGGSKSFVQRLLIDGRRRDLGLGPWPLVSLDEAREAAFKNRRMVQAGGNPIVEKRRASMPTFREAAERRHASKAFRNAKARKNWHQRLAKRVYPAIGDMPVDKIGRADVLAILDPIWTTHHETARKLRQYMREVFAWCQARDYIAANPAGESIDGALAPVRRARTHMRALPHSDIPAALDAVARSQAALATKLALRFLTLTAARSGEVRGATWDEIDRKARRWRIPAERMKSEREHHVPLSDSALAVLDEAAGIREASTDLIFPSPRRGLLSDNTLSKLLRDLRIQCVPHGFRSSFRDWCAETGKPREVAEAALAHVVPGVEGSYFRSDLFDRRRILMQAWADYLAGAPAQVVALHG